jgi:hypothetical protein
MSTLAERQRSANRERPIGLLDGWRERRFLLLYSPSRLFILPGVLISALGGLISLTVLAHIGALGRQWDVHTLIAGSLLLIVGVQIVSLGLCAEAYATYFMSRHDAWFDRARERYRLEHGLLLGGSIAVLGLTTIIVIVLDWIAHGFGSLAQERAALFASTLLVLGVQIVFSSFLLSIFGLRRSDA